MNIFLVAVIVFLLFWKNKAANDTNPAKVSAVNVAATGQIFGGHYTVTAQGTGAPIIFAGQAVAGGSTVYDYSTGTSFVIGLGTKPLIAPAEKYLGPPFAQ